MGDADGFSTVKKGGTGKLGSKYEKPIPKEESKKPAKKDDSASDNSSSEDSDSDKEKSQEEEKPKPKPKADPEPKRRFDDDERGPSRTEEPLKKTTSTSSGGKYVPPSQRARMK